MAPPRKVAAVATPAPYIAPSGDLVPMASVQFNSSFVVGGITIPIRSAMRFPVLHDGVPVLTAAFDNSIGFLVLKFAKGAHRDEVWVAPANAIMRPAR